MHEFPVNSRVVVVDSTSPWHGKVGAVVGHDTDGDALVEFMDRGWPHRRYLKRTALGRVVRTLVAGRRRSTNLIEKVLEVAHHRNGVSGAPFYAVRFTHIDDAGERRQMLATVFASAGHVSVVATDRLLVDGVAFGPNSWRGDQFERELRAAICASEEDEATAAHAPADEPGIAPADPAFAAVVDEALGIEALAVAARSIDDVMPEGRERDLARALAVLVLDSSSRAWLAVNDPKALEQAAKALAQIGGAR